MTANGHHPAPAPTATEGAVLSLLTEHNRLLEAILRSVGAEQAEPVIDTTLVVGGTLASATVVPVMALPRTVKHAELTLVVSQSSATPVAVAVFDGNVTAMDAANRHAIANITGQMSQAILATSGSGVEAREYLTGAGWLTFFFPAAFTGYANLRIRVLDKTQSYLRRT